MENEVEELEKVTERLCAILEDIISDRRSMKERLKKMELMLCERFGFPMPAREVEIDEPTTTIEPANQSINGEFEVLLENSGQISYNEVPLDEISKHDVLTDDDRLNEGVLVIADAVKNGEEIVQMEAHSELVLTKESLNFVAPQVFDEMPDSENCIEHKLKKQDKLEVVDLDEQTDGIMLVSSDEKLDNLKFLVVDQLKEMSPSFDPWGGALANDALKLELVPPRICGLLCTDEEWYDMTDIMGISAYEFVVSQHGLTTSESERVKDYWAEMFNFDPGGIWLRSSVDGITFKVRHEGLNEEQDDLKVPQVNSMEDVLPSLLDKSDFINMFKLLNEFAAQEKMMNAYTGVVCFDPGGKYLVRIGMLGNCVKPILNPLLVKPVRSNSQWVVLHGNSEPSMISMWGAHSSPCAEIRIDICFAEIYSMKPQELTDVNKIGEIVIFDPGGIQEFMLEESSYNAVMNPCTLPVFSAVVAAVESYIQLVVLINAKAWQEDQGRRSLSLNPKAFHVSLVSDAWVFGFSKASNFSFVFDPGGNFSRLIMVVQLLPVHHQSHVYNP